MANSDFSRRTILQLIGATALSSSPFSAFIPELLPEGREIAAIPGLPKIALEISGFGLQSAAQNADEAAMRRVKQLGVNDALAGGPPIPWQEDFLRTLMDRVKTGGLALGNLMISGFPRTIQGKPGRDEEIDKVRQSIRAQER